MSQYLVGLDCETGGLDPAKADLLTMYMGIVDSDFRVIDELDLRVKPDDRLPIVEAGAMRVNGIDLQKHLADPNTITYSEAYLKVLTFLKKYSQRIGKTLNLSVLGHNVPFDKGYVNHYILPVDDWNKLLHYDLVDTKAYVRLFKDAGIFPKEIGSLSSLVEFLQVPKRAAHNAKEDTLMTIECYKKLVDMLKGMKAGSGGTKQDLISLLEEE